MSWDKMVEVATKSHLNFFGTTVLAILKDGSSKEIKAILNPINRHLNEYDGEMQSFGLIVSISKNDVPDIQSVDLIKINDKEYEVIRRKIEPDGFHIYFLGE